MRVTVAGAGIVGLSSAYRLAEAGHDVTVVAAAPPAESTSAVAGGVVYPPGRGSDERIVRWTAASLAVFRGQDAPGVRFRRGRVLLPAGTPDPQWLPAVEAAVRDGDRVEFTTAVVDTPVYLEWLRERVAGLGVRVEYRTLTALSSLAADVVVNAAGLGAGALAGDRSMVPVGGQVVHVTDPGLAEFVVDGTGPGITYVIPHGGHVVCGGTEEPGRADTDPNPAVTADILRRCRELEPRLAGAEVLRSLVGLRPFRREVRLERDGDVVHCYGHGGAGITLAWGCAADVAELVTAG
ncbi:D-amino-acid oxidase [Amycolatopsis mediterranei S699]|uniref:D-amino-acid oxidase n=3 Tax=Amycolatopsis mediterranei TaxID=33910 RepID=A0A0H3D1F5_AMYMU|nr:FAD-dependent oxidoreductase [Amycolatopsis mediterranei]ADJ44475.1 D-amino-acid oxidase [Amycolatopsis mediterranei U32]AEK41213.1 D-amino-acid oxidase [Amycolatopsis mediterranei S699]AFO76189.1 D-amino-acid oxidase [Amycolatopsis mediterranei S699]AGT83318.1 D-amino-acid oxidase [Amycolatopsis mediterranei RB]KDO07168.1 D-amino acid oxidase [Amycolatopsis mediterranei]